MTNSWDEQPTEEVDIKRLKSVLTCITFQFGLACCHRLVVSPLGTCHLVLNALKSYAGFITDPVLHVFTTLRDRLVEEYKI